MTSFLFGSCNKQYRPQDHWERILSAMRLEGGAQQHPELWIWTGDAVYAKNQTLAGLQAAYQNLSRNVLYQRFSRQLFIDGIWDDHDLGINDAGALPDRDARAALYYNFLNSGRLLKRRPGGVKTAASNKGGMYHSKVLKKGAGRCKIIFLDTRYSREPHCIPSLGQFDFPLTAFVAAALRMAYSVLGFGQDYAGDVLGEAQWRWLESELEHSHRGRISAAAFDAAYAAASADQDSGLTAASQVIPAKPVVPVAEQGGGTSPSSGRRGGEAGEGEAFHDFAAAASHAATASTARRLAREAREKRSKHDFDYHVIVSSIQVFTSNPVLESWGHFPAAKRRLVALLQKYDPSGLVILSGDVHYGETVTVPVYLHGAGGGAGGVGGGGDSCSGGVSAAGVGGGSCSAAAGRSVHRAWVEVTSSGLTHTAADGLLNGLLCPLMLRAFGAHRGRLDASGQGQGQGQEAAEAAERDGVYIGKNFGSVVFDKSSLNVSVRDIPTGRRVLTRTVLPHHPLAHAAGAASSASGALPSAGAGAGLYLRADYVDFPRVPMAIVVAVAVCLVMLVWWGVRGSGGSSARGRGSREGGERIEGEEEEEKTKGGNAARAEKKARKKDWSM